MTVRCTVCGKKAGVGDQDAVCVTGCLDCKEPFCVKHLDAGFLCKDCGEKRKYRKDQEEARELAQDLAEFGEIVFNLED